MSDTPRKPVSRILPGGGGFCKSGGRGERITHQLPLHGSLQGHAQRQSSAGRPIQGYLAHKKYPPPRTLWEDYTWGPMVVVLGGGGSYERGTPITTDKGRYLSASSRYPNPKL